MDDRNASKKIKAYSPSHITGFFMICDHKNPVYKGSLGGGIVLEAGCVTEVSLADHAGLTINGVEKDAPTTHYVLEHLVTASEVIVSTNFDVPIACGFGASGAGA